MRRFLAGFLIALALGVGIGVAGAKVVTVTNPMTADLDGGGHAISNVSTLTADWLVGNNKVSVNGETLLAGEQDPSLGLTAPAGSLYLRRNPDALNVAQGELWLKTGIYDGDWIKVAG